MIHTPRGFAYLQHIDRQPRTQRHIRAPPTEPATPPNTGSFPDRSAIGHPIVFTLRLRRDLEMNGPSPSVWRIAGCLAATVVFVGGCTSSSADGPTGSSGSGSSSAPSPSVADVSPSPSSQVATSAVPTSSEPALVPTEVSGSSDPASREIADRAAVENAWNNFWIAALGIVRVKDEERVAVLSEVAVDPLRSQILTEARESSARGLDRYGAMTAHPYWGQSIDGKSAAVMGDCQDSSNSGTIDISTGQHKTVGVADNNIRATFVRTDDGRWKVQDIFYLVDVPC